MLDRPATARDNHEARAVSRLDGRLRDELLGKLVVVVGSLHRRELYGLVRQSGRGRAGARFTVEDAEDAESTSGELGGRLLVVARLYGGAGGLLARGTGSRQFVEVRQDGAEH